MIKKYLEITKPGIILGNLISVISGFCLASQGSLDLSILILTLLGVSLIIASACVCNNYIDRDIDAIMDRTKNRVLAKGLISLRATLIYAALLGLAGIAILYFSVTMLTAVLASIGFIIYVLVYSLHMKRNSTYATLIGSISGSLPPVIGYCAISKYFDTGALILLTIFSLWQMPHSYAIAIFCFEDYRKAKIPVLPVVKGILVTKKYILLYILAFMFASMMLSFSGYAGYKYLSVSIGLSIWWFTIALSGYRKNVDDRLWARKLFLLSIITITCTSIMISIDFSSSVT
ncbi:heme o synthase [Candidatus Profftia tarda]|uniref:heme o synthase n=1 Tax=Candidatus Profftia tarda TaxID=1177216 RepID=UPI001C1F976C|nr:heme o synthase [Candidatus Profftia tarda]